MLRPAIWAAAIVMSCVPGLARSQSVNPAGDRPQLPSWIVNCSNANPQAELRCAMTQNLQLSSTGQRVLTISIERRNDQPRATLLLPHGIDLVRGVRYAVDGGEQRVAVITHADQNGSYASFAIDTGLLEAMRKGAILRVVAAPLSGEELVIELTLSGFSSAWAMLERN